MMMAMTMSAMSRTGTSLHESIIAVQQAEGCELVIKEHRPDSPLKRALLTPTDWKLLRQCPCAVLMVKSERPWTGGVILAAVDVGNQDEDHRRLHASIIDHGYAIAGLAKATCISSVRTLPMLSASDPVYQLSETIERYREACSAFQAEYDISEDRLHVAEGPADVLIPHLQKQLTAVVTVIGTVARTGISGALIGNTAEVVLDSLESDVLVLKSEEATAHLAELARWVYGRERQNPYLHAQIGVCEMNLDDDLLSHGETPHYHRRCIVSLLSSGWDQVVPMLYGRQEILLPECPLNTLG